MFVYAGIDEAGYGPMLGPLVVACTCFVVEGVTPRTPAPLCLWGLLESAVSRESKGSRGRLVVNDSKKVKLPNPKSASGGRHPLLLLEPSVLAFLGVMQRKGAGSVPGTDEALLGLVDPELGARLQEIPWYQGEALPLPQSVAGHDAGPVRIAVNVLDRAMQRAGVRVSQVACQSLTAGRFNRMARAMRSKAAVSMTLVGRLLQRVIDEHGESHPFVAVDRQSGTTHYRRALQTLFPSASIRIVSEDSEASTYGLELDRDRRATVSFVKGGDGLHLPTSLASMTAKYVRELTMIRFNRYFAGMLPEVKPTAGYVQDARRFLGDVDGVIRERNLDRDELIRMC